MASECPRVCRWGGRPGPTGEQTRPGPPTVQEGARVAGGHLPGSPASGRGDTRVGKAFVPLPSRVCPGQSGSSLGCVRGSPWGCPSNADGSQGTRTLQGPAERCPANCPSILTSDGRAEPPTPEPQARGQTVKAGANPSLSRAQAGGAWLRPRPPLALLGPGLGYCSMFLDPRHSPLPGPSLRQPPEPPGAPAHPHARLSARPAGLRSLCLSLRTQACPLRAPEWAGWSARGNGPRLRSSGAGLVGGHPGPSALPPDLLLKDLHGPGVPSARAQPGGPRTPTGQASGAPHKPCAPAPRVGRGGTAWPRRGQSWVPTPPRTPLLPWASSSPPVHRPVTPGNFLSCLTRVPLQMAAPPPDPSTGSRPNPTAEDGEGAAGGGGAGTGGRVCRAGQPVQKARPSEPAAPALPGARLQTVSQRSGHRRPGCCPAGRGLSALLAGAEAGGRGPPRRWGQGAGAGGPGLSVHLGQERGLPRRRVGRTWPSLRPDSAPGPRPTEPEPPSGLPLRVPGWRHASRDTGGLAQSRNGNRCENETSRQHARLNLRRIFTSLSEPN